MSDFVFVIAVGSSNPRRSTLRAFNVRQICSEQCIQELTVEDTQPMRVRHIACQGKFLLLLTSTSSLPSHQPLAFNSFADILRHGTSWKQPRSIASTSSRESVYPSHIPHTPTSGIRSRTSAAIESSMSGK